MPDPAVMPESPRGPSPAAAGIDPADLGQVPADSQPVIDLRQNPAAEPAGEE